MTKIFFPFREADRFSFAYRDIIDMTFRDSPTIQFPIIIDGGFKFDLSVDASGITFYLDNAKTHLVKGGDLSARGIEMYLKNEQTDTYKRVYVDFKQLGLGLYLLEMIDSLSLGELDSYTLGDISYCFADWKQLRYSVITLGSDTIIVPVGTSPQLIGRLTTTEKNVEICNLHSDITLSDIGNLRHMTLGELDPKLIADIDLMASVFRTFGKTPAVLVQEIDVTE